MEKYNDTQIAANHIESYFKTAMGAVTQYAVSSHTTRNKRL